MSGSEQKDGLGRRRRAAAAAAAVLAVAAIHPPQGIGTNLCLMRRATGLQCPGCGMTRSLSCAIRGKWGESFEHHPLGLAMLVLLAGAAVFGLVSSSLAARVAATLNVLWLDHRVSR